MFRYLLILKYSVSDSNNDFKCLNEESIKSESSAVSEDLAKKDTTLEQINSSLEKNILQGIEAKEEGLFSFNMF